MEEGREGERGTGKDKVEMSQMSRYGRMCITAKGKGL